jgi:hypothetical protein
LSSSLVTLDSNMNRREKIRIEYERLFDHLMVPNSTLFVLPTHLMDD